LRSEEIAHKHQLTSTKEQYIKELDYFEHYNSERCWKTATTSLRTYDQLKSETARMKSIKEQISIHRKALIGKMLVILALKMELFFYVNATPNKLP